MTNIPIDWKVFEYKFSQNPRRAFENLSNILFCYEMKQPYGIFRYFNQPYIETSTVMAPDGLVTGFQAKYYDAGTPLSSKEAELKKAIEGAKKKYININRILFYVNKEMSASTRKDTEKPAYQSNIEKYGRDLGITIEWRVLGNIEQILLDLPNIRDLYFNPRPGLMRYIELIQIHGESLLANIQSEILYQERTIKILHDTQELHKFLSSDSSVCIVYGEAGTGKSGIVKDLINEIQIQNNGSDFFIFSTTDLDVEEEVLFLKKYGEYLIEDAFSLYPEDGPKLCVIESAEKLFTLTHPQVFESLIRKFISNGWKMIFTIRTAYKNGFCNLVLSDIPFTEIQINRISAEMLKSLGEQYNFQLPKDEKVKDLLRDLFYLKLYLKLSPLSLDEQFSSELFMEQIWRKVIRNDDYRVKNLPTRREQMARNIIFSMLHQEVSIYRSGAADDYEALQALEESGVIAAYDGSADSWMMSHDVYEEMIVKHIFTDRYQQHIFTEKFRDGFGASLRARKLYRIWLEDLLAQGEKDLVNFLISVLQSFTEQPWKDETLIALMQSSSDDAFRILNMVMSWEQYKLFARAVFLLNTACRDIDRELIQKLSGLTVNQYRITRPDGSAWYTIFKFIYNNRTQIPWNTQTLDIVVNSLKTWTGTFKTGETTRFSGIIALNLKSLLWKNTEYPHSPQRDERFIMLNDTILASAMELKQELSIIFNDAISAGIYDECRENDLLLEKSLSNIFNCGQICQALPLEVIRLAENSWLKPTETEYEYDFGSIEIESAFGLSSFAQRRYEPSSAFQTPLYILLQVNPKEAMDLILRLLNRAADFNRASRWENNHHETFEIEIRLSSKEVVRQICSDRFWNMYRGTSVAPELLESALMALEKWLLEGLGNAKPEILSSCCLYLLRNSKTAAITAVILSAVVSCPDKLFEIACILLKTKEIFILDVARLQAEGTANLFKGAIASHKLYDDERIKSNNLDFRKIHFEKILIDYQLKPPKLSQKEFDERLKRLYMAFDEATTDIDSWEPTLQYAYYRADLRKRRVSTGKTTEGKSFIALETDYPENLTKISAQNEQNRQQLFQHIPLFYWADARLKHDQQAAQIYSQFEIGPDPVLNEVKQILKEEGGFHFFDMATAINACCVLLKDEKEQMRVEQSALCANIVMDYCRLLAVKKCIYQTGAGFEAAISTLVTLVSSSNLSAEWTNPLFLLLALMMTGKKACEISLASVSNFLWESDKKAAWKLLRTYAGIVPRYLKEVRRDTSVEQFFSDNASEIEKMFQEDVYEFINIPTNELEINQLILLQRMMSPKDKTLFDMVLKIGERIWDTIFGKYPKDKKIRRDYESEHGYMQWLGEYVLNLSEDLQSVLLESLMQKVRYDREFISFLKIVICAEDTEPRYDSFWNFWSLLKNYIFSECEKNDEKNPVLNNSMSTDFGLGGVLTVYLLAFIDMQSWHSLRDEAFILYQEAANRIGNASILYAICKVLNTLGSNIFFNYGVEWLSDLVEHHPEIHDASLPMNTVYYAEEYMYRYVKDQIYTLKSDPQRRQKVLNVLNFLVNRGSSLGFMLREEVI